MDKRILELKDEGNRAELYKVLNGIPERDIKTLIDHRAVKGRGDASAFIRAIFYGSAANTTDGAERRMTVFRHCIHLLQANDLSSKVASEMIGILLLETDGFPASCLVDLTTLFVESIKSGVGTTGKALELFPKLLSALAAQDVVNAGTRETTGAEYKSHILNNLCSGRWDAGTVIHLATMFRDVPLTPDELKFILVKMVRMFSEIGLQELPPLVYQMLLLSTKGHKKLVLEGVTSFFVNRDRIVKQKQKNTNSEFSEDIFDEPVENSDQLRHVEGTIILHITFAIKQDQDLGREFIKYLKTHQQSNAAAVLAPFNVALALSIARIHRFEDPVLDLLKATVLKSFKDAEKQTSSQWVRDMVPDSCDMAHLLLDTVHNSVYGWDHVSQGLVQLGFTLMDSFGPKGVFGKVVVDTNSPSHRSPTQRACQLGASILQEIFKVQEMVRADILEQILNRVVTKATAPVSHYIDLLAGTVRAAPQILLDSLPKIREAFDYLSYLPPPTADGLLTAVQPLMKLSMSLKDGLMLTLRKAMFSRQLESRKIAVSGFLMLLSRFRILGGLPTSQASQSFSASQLGSVDVHTPYNSSLNEAVCLEILGTLRRALGQQADVRLALYEGLFDVLCQNSQLRLPIISLLLKQFKTYYEDKTDLQPPVKLEPCIIAQGDQVFLGEPMSHLLCCLVLCYLKSQDQATEQPMEEEDDDCLLEAEEILESTTRRLIKSELEDFELDRSADFSTTNSVGVRNNIFSILAVGCYESLIEYNFHISKFEPAGMQNVLQLFVGYQRFSDLLKDKNTGGGGGKRGRPTGGAPSGKPTTKSLLSLRCVTAMLAALYSEVPPAHQEGADVLRSSKDFGRFVLGVVLQKLRQVDEKGQCEGAHGQDQSKIFTHCTEVAKITSRCYTTDLQAPDTAEKDRGKVAGMCLEALATSVHIICHRYKERLAEFLRDMDTTDGAELSETDEIHKHIKTFQRVVVSVLTSTEDDRSLKEAILLFNIIGWLSESLPVASAQCAQVQTWAQRLASEQTIDDTGVTKSLISLLFSLSVRQTNVAPMLREMAQDIHRELGDIDQEVELAGEGHYATVTARTAAPTVLLQLLAQADRELDDTEWVISRIKADLTRPPAEAEEEPSVTQRESHEKGVCSRLGHIINTCHELVQSAVPVGPCIDNLVKLVTRLYGTLTQLVKYHLAVYTHSAGNMTARFEKLVRLSGTNLTQFTYAMINYIQASQSEHLQQTTEKRKKKDRQISSAVAVASKAKVLKETRFIPSLIFSIEQYEKFLIQLTKKTKVNLMEHMKLSTSRDFRINVAQLSSALEEQDSEEEEEADVTEAGPADTSDTTVPPNPEVQASSSDQNSSDEENAEPPNKKTRPEPPPKKGKLGTSLKGKGRGKKSA